MEIFSSSKPKGVDVCVAILEVVCGGDVIQPRGTKRSLWPWWPNPQGRGAAANQALSARTWAQAPCEVQLAQNHISNCNNQFASKSRAKMCMYKLIVNSF